MKETLVGTLFCGENDFEQCKIALSEQTYQNFDHLVISNKPEVQAHKELYQAFKSGKYKYLIKVDADIVLNSNRAIELMVSAAKKKIGNKFPLRVTADVDDFFTGILLQGLHLYSQEVDWDWGQFTPDCRKPDRLDSIHRMKQNNRIVKMRQVLGKHCYYASPKQAFHFGYHRALKGQIDRCRDVINNYKIKDNDMLWMVCLGIYSALTIKDTSGYCYGIRFDEIFDEYSKNNLSRVDVINRVSKMCGL